MPGVSAYVAPVLSTFAQVREDLAAHLVGLTREQVWRQIGPASLGFHLKHIAGSVDRLTTYLFGGQLSAEQLATLAAESSENEDWPALFGQIEAALHRSEEMLRALDPKVLDERRAVGRQALPTTVIGLIVHLAEHTQRHLGQAITMSQVVRQLS
jgi:uncharacterized damage-inducible protein DinB